MLRADGVIGHVGRALGAARACHVTTRHSMGGWQSFRVGEASWFEWAL